MYSMKFNYFISFMSKKKCISIFGLSQKAITLITPVSLKNIYFGVSPISQNNFFLPINQ